MFWYDSCHHHAKSLFCFLLLYTHITISRLYWVMIDSVVNKLEIRFRKHLAKLTGPAVRLDSKKPKGEKKRWKKKKAGAVFIMNSKIHLRKIAQFKNATLLVG